MGRRPLKEYIRDEYLSPVPPPASAITADSSEAELKRWEQWLNQDTISAGREIPFDPIVLERLLEECFNYYLEEVTEGEGCSDGRLRQVIALVQYKCMGSLQKALLFILEDNCSYREIARRLGKSKDYIRRIINKGVKLMKEVIFKEFPVYLPASPDETIRSALFPLDTAEEHKRFQKFINSHQVIHIAYALNGDLREALILYRSGS